MWHFTELQFSSVAQSCPTFAISWTTACQASLSITNSWGPPKPMSIESVMPSNHLILCQPFSSCLQSFIRVFSSESVLCIRWPKYWSLSFNISRSNEYSGLISLRLTGLISLESKGLSRVFFNTTVQKHQFFGVQLSLWSNSHPYMTTGKTMALTRWTFVCKVMSLLLKMLSRLVIAFLPRSECLLISLLHSPSAVILEPEIMKYGTVSIISPSIRLEVMGPVAMIFVFWMLSLSQLFGSLDPLHFLPLKWSLHAASIYLSLLFISSLYSTLLLWKTFINISSH